MNSKTEIQKIKVNNGSELVVKAKEYKNSGGEWKLWERYIEMPINSSSGKFDPKRKNRLGWGIVISDGKQTIDIFSPESNIDYKDFVEKDLILMDEIDARPELWKLFLEAKYAHFDKGDERKNTATRKELKKDNEDYALYRYLVAENFHHLEKIIENYFRENEAKIYNSPNSDFSNWVEIINGQDGNTYLYIGEKNANGGREIKVGIKKEAFDKKETERLKDREKYFSGSEMLETDWNLYLMSSDQPQTPAQLKKYFSGNGGLEEHWQTVERNWERACRTTLETLREQLVKALEYWDNEPNKEVMNQEINKVNQKLGKINRRLEQMEKEYPDWYHAAEKICSECGEKMCCWHEKGQRCERGSKNYSPSKNPLLSHDFSGGSSPSPKSKSLSEIDKNQLLQYFLTYGISKIVLENGKLKVKYSQKGARVVNSSELEKYKKFIQSSPNHSISLKDLQTTTNNSSNPSQKPSDNKLLIGLTVGAGITILAGGISFIIWNRRQKRSKN